MPPIDLNNSEPVKPVPGSAEPDPIAGSAINMNEVEAVSPKKLASEGTPLPALAGAGVALTKWVLVMVSSVLVLLIILVMCQEIRYTSFTNEIYRKGIPEPQSWNMTASLKNVLEDLRSVENRPTEGRVTLSNAAEKIAILERGDSYEAALKEIENDIRIVAGKRLDGDAFNTELLALVARTEARSRSMTTYSTSVEQIKANQELLKEYVGAANAAREFWMRIAQLVLLNLLLPVLTALLGYVFASKQSEKS